MSQRLRLTVTNYLISNRAFLNRSMVILLWLLILLGTCIRFRVAMEYNPIHAIWSDPGRHWHYAQNTLLDEPMSAMDPIMYQIWLSVVVKLTLGDPFLVGVYAGLLSAITPWIWYRFLLEALPQKQIALLGWAIFIWLPSWIGIFSYFMNETLLLPMLGLALWSTWRSFKQKTLASFIWCSLAWIGTSLTRFIAAPLGFVSIIWILKKQTQKATKILILVLILVCCLTPPAYRSYKILKVWNPFGYAMENQIYMESGKKEIQFELFKSNKAFRYTYGFASPSMGEKPLEPLFDWQTSRSGVAKFTIDIDRGVLDWEQALKENKGGILLRLQMRLENLIFVLFGKAWPDCNPAHFWENLAVQSRWIWVILLLLVVSATSYYIYNKKSLPLLPTLLLLNFLIYIAAPFPLEGRFRKPLEGLLIVNTLWLLSAYIENRRQIRDHSNIV